MPRSSSAAEFNNFVAGLITEASPLTFPANASLDEQNFVLKRDGSRRRRLGMDFEDGYQIIPTNAVVSVAAQPAVNSYQWKNAGGDPDRTLIVVQVGTTLKFFDTNASPLSSGLLASVDVVGADQSLRFSFTSVDASLIVATGTPDIRRYGISGTGAVEEEIFRLKIRDLFGVEDVSSGTDLREGSNIDLRPSIMTDGHSYNLRNQTWAKNIPAARRTSVSDPIRAFFLEQSFGKYPSNSDVTTYSIYPDTPDGQSEDIFWPRQARRSVTGLSPAPKGYFIIDALNRGTSRKEEHVKLLDRYPTFSYDISTLPSDYTPGGAKAVSEYAGRVFYAGFSGEVIDGDRHSPKMSSYILFSRLVQDPTDAATCYQEGDPTSKENPDLIDTDGGFLRIEGAYGIHSLINVGPSLMVLAENGVWMLQGGNNFGFKATDYKVSKITSYGCTCRDSIVQVDTSVMYWSFDGIYNISQNQFGDYVADSLTQKSIQTMFDQIEPVDKLSAKGVYDSYERKVYWLYKNYIGASGSVSKLVLDLTLGAFYKFTVDSPNIDGRLPLLVSGLTVPAFRQTEVAEDVNVNNVQVTASGDVVSVTSMIKQSVTTETLYVAIVQTSPSISFTFCKYTDEDFIDWRSYDNVGVDASAFLLTGWLTGGDSQKTKQVPYVTFHFGKTEDGFETVGDEDFVPAHQSSCKVSAQWNWANSAISGKWGREFQAYRFRRHFFPTSEVDSFDNGFQTVVTKNKLRGSGKALSLLIRTEPLKDCHLLGWSMILGTNGNV